MGGSAQWAGEAEDFDPVTDWVAGVNGVAELRDIEREETARAADADRQ